jgi:hypothetical protein
MQGNTQQQQNKTREGKMRQEARVHKARQDMIRKHKINKTRGNKRRQDNIGQDKIPRTRSDNNNMRQGTTQNKDKTSTRTKQAREHAGLSRRRDGLVSDFKTKQDLKCVFTLNTL